MWSSRDYAKVLSFKQWQIHHVYLLYKISQSEGSSKVQSFLVDSHYLFLASKERTEIYECYTWKLAGLLVLQLRMRNSTVMSPRLILLFGST